MRNPTTPSQRKRLSEISENKYSTKSVDINVYVYMYNMVHYKWHQSCLRQTRTDPKRIVPRNHLIGLFLLNLPQGSKNVQRCTDHPNLFCPYCSLISEMIESASFFINFTLFFNLWHLHRRTPSQMSPNHAKMPHIFNNPKEG